MSSPSGDVRGAEEAGGPDGASVSHGDPGQQFQPPGGARMAERARHRGAFAPTIRRRIVFLVEHVRILTARHPAVARLIAQDDARNRQLQVEREERERQQQLEQARIIGCSMKPQRCDARLQKSR